MPPVLKTAHDGVPYHSVRSGDDPGCYQLHRPSQCWQELPLTKKPIHKCDIPKREYCMVHQKDYCRALLVPNKNPNLYPAIIHRKEYERLQQQAKIVTQEEKMAALESQELAAQKAAKESRRRKKQLKAHLQPQPGAEVATGTADPELEGPDQAAHTMSRTEQLLADKMQGPSLCNRIILASKCVAIRDAQITEKKLIKKEFEEEERRLDTIMEENRQAAIKRAEEEEERRHNLRLQNLAALKEQIRAHEIAKILKADCIEEESVHVNQANIAMQLEETQKLKEKHQQQLKFREMLDQGNADFLYYKQLRNEEERITDLRIEKFLKQKMERESKFKADAKGIKTAREKGVDYTAEAQKAEQELKAELERIRNLKIQEDVERKYRSRARDAAIKKNKEMKLLHEAREQQIRDNYRYYARDIVKDEQHFNNAARRNEELMKQQKELDEKRKMHIEQHRRAIMKQINEKERARAELRGKIHNEGVALRMKQDQQEKYEKKIIKEKVAAMRQQNIEEKYVKQVERMLFKYGYVQPSQCGLKFPPTKKPIHKCEVPQREYYTVPQLGTWRQLLLPKRKPNFYPAIMHRKDYETLQQNAKIVTQEETLAAFEAQELATKKAAKEAERRKNQLKADLKPQPGAEVATGTADPELDGPDQAAHIMSRAEELRADNMQGPRLCNRIILASKCHAIRDAQITEKELIKKELDEEERRLDAIMEENRQAAVNRSDEEEERRHNLRLQNLAALKEQIAAHDSAKILEAERIEEESIRLNQGNIAVQLDEAQKVKEKHTRQLKLKEMLDQGNEELIYYKQLQHEEERIMNLRIENFLKQKMERESKNRAQAEAIKAAKQKGISHIAQAQKAEQMLKEELDRIRNLKIQEDVEREYRRREREAAIRKNKEMKQLHKAREEQIRDIHRLIAREIAKDEQSFNNAARQNEEFIQKEKELENKRQAAIEKHRREIMKQINDKERARAELREKIHNEGVALRMEQDQQEKYEKRIIKGKVATLRQQKVAEKYVKEVEQTLAKHGYK